MTAPQSVALFAASVVEALRTEVRWYLADQIVFAADPEVEGGLLARVPHHGGTLAIRIHAADEWDAKLAGFEGEPGLPLGTPLLAVNWGEHPSGAFTGGTYLPGVVRAVWAISAADAFSWAIPPTSRPMV